MSEQRPDQLSTWQKRAMQVPESIDLFLGGGRGGGKSFLLAALFLRHCEQHKDRARCLVLGRPFFALQDLEAEFLANTGALSGNALKLVGKKHRLPLPIVPTIRLDK